MKKLLAIALALGFMAATSGLVLAEGNTASPVSTSGKGHKKHHTKKPKTSKTAPSSSSSAPAPAGK